MVGLTRRAWCLDGPVMSASASHPKHHWRPQNTNTAAAHSSSQRQSPAVGKSTLTVSNLKRCSMNYRLDTHRAAEKSLPTAQYLAAGSLAK
jgi:hypothetical protein